MGEVVQFKPRFVDDSDWQPTTAEERREWQVARLLGELGQMQGLPLYEETTTEIRDKMSALLRALKSQSKQSTIV